VSLAGRLAAVFGRTGLWPVLWGANDAPTGYMGPPEPVAGIGAVRVPATFRNLWRYWRLPRTFPGMAAASRTGESVDPFAIFGAHTSAEYADGPPYRLLLISAARPADALARTGLELNDQIGDTAMAAILRSWETRFRAVVVQFGTGYIVVAVQAPPTDPDAARSLAAELYAIAPPSGPGPTVNDLAGSLIGGVPTPPGDGGSSVVTPQLWEISF